MKTIRLLILLAAGILSIVLGIMCFNMDEGYYESSHTYGGDAYTGIQNAAAQSANNTRYLTKITRFGFGSVLLVGGLGMVTAGLSAFDKEEKRKIDSPEWEEIPPAKGSVTVPDSPVSVNEKDVQE